MNKTRRAEIQKHVIAIDFDGTCVDHAYPKIGKDVPLAINSLKKLVKEGHKLILYTMRSGRAEADAIQWFLDNNIDLYAVQTNPTQICWTASCKCYAHIYIDDAAYGCPLINVKGFNKPCVDWSKIII